MFETIATPVAVIGWLMPQAVRTPLLLAWFENERARRRLAECQTLDPRFAGDIGVTPAQIATECAAPFWTGLTLSRGDAAR